MATYIQIGDRIDYKNATGTTIKAGDVVALGTNRIAVADCQIEPGELGTLALTGVGSFRQTTAQLSSLARLPTGMQQAKDESQQER